MIFRKNKPAPGPENQNHAPRGRDSQPDKRGANALARRFLVEDEPDTIDLAGPGGFPDPAAESEPDTRVSAEASPEEPAPDRHGVLSHDAETGKFYVHAGTAEAPVLLCGEAVTAPTELRKGDRIRVGAAEFEFLGPVTTN